MENAELYPQITRITQIGLGRNQILAPEEPNVYSTAITAGPALQRSAMFPAMAAQVEQPFRSSGARRTLLESRVL